MSFTIVLRVIYSGYLIWKTVIWLCTVDTTLEQCWLLACAPVLAQPCPCKHKIKYRNLTRRPSLHTLVCPTGLIGHKITDNKYTMLDYCQNQWNPKVFFQFKCVFFWQILRIVDSKCVPWVWYMRNIPEIRRSTHMCLLFIANLALKCCFFVIIVWID